MHVISIVGVSVLHNYPCRSIQDLKRIFTKQYKADYFDASIQEKNHKIIIALQDDIVAKFKRGEGALSAEIVSLIKLQEDIEQPLSVTLLCTDTNESYFSALCIEQYFKFFSNRQIHIQTIEVVDKLSIVDKPTFDIGLNNLLQKINTIGEQTKWQNLIINITTGYKILIPHLTLIGQIFKIRLVYLFDDGADEKDEAVDFNTKKLLNAPELPIHFDWKFLEPYLELIKKFNNPKTSGRFKEEYFLVKEYTEKGLIRISKSQISKTELVLETLSKEKLSSINGNLILFIEESIKHGLLDEQLCPTAIASLIQAKMEKRPAANDFLGVAMEAFVKSYFMLPAEKKAKTVQFYSIALDFSQKQQYFKIIDLQNKQIELCQGNADTPIKIGDIDVPLLNTKDNTIVLCEVKALAKFKKYYDKIDTKADYYLQLKARAMAYLKTKPNSTVEILLLIYQFQIEHFEEDLSKEFYDKENKYRDIILHLVGLEQDNDLKGLGAVVFKTVVLQKIQKQDSFGATSHFFYTEPKFNIFTQIDFNKL